jgi:NADH:ubiquinone oxidoreductase subunit F (NADH-binding)
LNSRSGDGAIRWSTPEVRSLAGDDTRLLLDANAACHRETLSEYQDRGGYLVGRRGEDLLAAVEAAHLVGRGGAAFPMAIKLRAVRDRPGPRVVVANGEEGEPLSVKDRWLLRIRPHLVIDGLLRAAGLVGAETAYIYLSDPVAALSVREALTELAESGEPVGSAIAMSVVEVEPAYVAGEETAVVRWINGGPALPTDKPPRPFEAGVDGRPTLVSNVETLANLVFADELGPRAFLAGDREATAPRDTILLTLSGAGRDPALHEIELGTTLRSVLAEAGGHTGPIQGALMGGYFAGLIGARVLDLPLAYQPLRAEGSGLGCAAIWLIGADECPVRLASDVMHYFEHNNARQCGPCLRGTGAMSATLDRLAAGIPAADDLDRLSGWSVSLLGRGACGYLDGAATLPATLLREFPDHVREHTEGGCELARTSRGDRLQRLRVTPR